MTEEEKARELARLREPELPPRTSEQEYYRQRLRRMRQQGVPVRLSVREGWSLPGSNGSSRGG
ncbi:MAG: hypothetical protein OIF57_02915 [Marinobacterium sp.]|nr:hypothetical protein [Marinobacterium sp.]